MRAVVTRVKNASVVIGEKVNGQIGTGFLVLLGVHQEDTEAQALKIADKICGLRVFEDENGKMNMSPADAGAELLIISQFTLFAATARGNRPSYCRASKQPVAEPLYELFCSRMEEALGKPVGRGIFGADMKVSLTNDGPVTILFDTEA